MSEAPSLRSLTTLESGLNMVSSQPIDDAAKLDAQILVQTPDNVSNTCSRQIISCRAASSTLLAKAATAELAELQAQMEGKGGTVPSVAGRPNWNFNNGAF